MVPPALIHPLGHSPNQIKHHIQLEFPDPSISEKQLKSTNRRPTVMIWPKETVERSHGETIYVLKPKKTKQLALKNPNFNPPKNLPKCFSNFFHFYIKQLFSADATV